MKSFIRIWIRIRVKIHYALDAQIGAMEGRGCSEWRRGRVEAQNGAGGSVDQWSQIRITLMRSRIADTDPHPH